MPGYDHPLLILPFDHRSSFTKNLFSFTSSLTTIQFKQVIDVKEMIYYAFMMVYDVYPCQDHLGILVDETFGYHILEDAKQHGVNIAAPVEKSGQHVFSFEYGAKFGKHLSYIAPTFAKALVRYHPKNTKQNTTQLKRLQKLSAFCQKQGMYLMIELLLPAEKKAYTSRQQSLLVKQSIAQMQKHQIEPDIWKLEGYATQADWQRVMGQIRNISSRGHVSAIVLGRGEDKKQVRKWLEVGAQAAGVVGFAVGRTIFFEPLQKFLQKKYTKKEAILEIAKRYITFIKIWNDAKSV